MLNQVFNLLDRIRLTALSKIKPDKKTRRQDVVNQFGINGKACFKNVPHVPGNDWISHPALISSQAKVCEVCHKIVDIRMGYGK